MLHKGLFAEDEFKIPENAKNGRDLLVGSPEILPDDLVMDSILVRSTEYKTNQLVVLKVFSQDALQVGWVKKIIVRGNKVVFLVVKSICVRRELRYFCTYSRDSSMSSVSYSELVSFKPLIPRGSEVSFLFFLYGKLQSADD